MRKRRLKREAVHLEVTAFINLIVVLVPFLLSTAVFTRLSVMDLALPAPSAGGPLDRIKAGELQLEVVIRKDGFEVGDRVGGLIQRIDRANPAPANATGAPGAAASAVPATRETLADGRVALKTLNALMVQIKQRFPDKTEVSVLAEPETSYDQLVQVMDAVRAAPSSRIENGSAKVVMAELFPDIAVGDAPVRGGAAR
ncbi:MAG: biopolymer transporter ExbD [Betaproteobacteria bacterium]|nr:biopolymer transporter ExbD [Betaproteobacteria bacterium]MCC6247538.1 biopolymer transporter ExbD [Rubrivivax sp.]